MTCHCVSPLIAKTLSAETTYWTAFALLRFDSQKQVHQVGQTWLPPSRIASLACVCAMAACPLLKKEAIQKEPCDSKGYTLMIMRTELKAVPHAGLGYHFLRVQVRKPEKEVEVQQVQRGHQI